MENLIHYFKTGLENNELCIWITSEPLDVEEAKRVTGEAIPCFNTCLKNGQIEIIPYTYVKNCVLDTKKILNGWFEKIDPVLATGYDGLRLSINAFWLRNKNWNNFIKYGKNR